MICIALKHSFLRLLVIVILAIEMDLMITLKNQSKQFQFLKNVHFKNVILVLPSPL